MSEQPQSYLPTEINILFAKFNPAEVEQFYHSYQLWMVQQQITSLQAQISALQQQKSENHERMQNIHPTAIALATLARLQSYGVNDIDLLDRMLERGEIWLDLTMQRLTYCEQLDFISNNYSEWCEHALDGAYDWIDSLYNNSSPSDITQQPDVVLTSTNDILGEATEEILLQKLMSDDAEDETFLLETTLKRAAVVIAKSEDPVAEEAKPPAVDKPQASELSATSSGGTQLYASSTEPTEVMVQPGVSNEELASAVSDQSEVEALSQHELSDETAANSNLPPPSQQGDESFKPVPRPHRKRSILQRFLMMLRRK